MWGADLTAPSLPFDDRLVMIGLDVLFGPPPPDTKPNPDGNLTHGLVLTGQVPGQLRGWARSIDGRWLGIGNFSLCDKFGAV